MKSNLERRLQVLESIPITQNSSSCCNPNRRLAKFNATLLGASWECTGNAEQRAKRDAKLVRYREYFSQLEDIDENRLS